MSHEKQLRSTLGSVLFSLATAVVVFAGVAAPASAGDFDGSRALLCVPTDMFECARGMRCIRVTADEINIPPFVDVDFGKKTISGTRRGKEDVTPIQNLKTGDGRTILQGVDAGMAWSVLIDHASGKMSMSVNASTIAGHPIGFSILGACTVR